MGLLIIVFCLLFFLSCSSRNRLEGYVYYRLNTNPTTLDPALIVDVTGGTIAAKLFNGLVRTGDDLGTMPDIAERWSVSEGGLKYTFHLRRGVLFSNGREVKADDFRYSFERILDPKSKSPNTWTLDKIAGAGDFMKGLSSHVSGIRVVNDYELEIRLAKPFSPFLNLLTMTSAYVLPKEEVQRWGPDFSSHPSGTGPFTLKEWMPNREVVLERRPDYFETNAKVRGIIYRIIPEDLTAVTEYEIGNIDILTIPASEFIRYRKDPSKSALISSINGLNTYYLGLNCSKFPFNDKYLRMAMRYAIDSKKILNTIYEKRGRKACGPLPDILRRWSMPCQDEYDPQKARDIIRKEGYSGITVNFYITSDQEVIDIAEIIQSYLESAGMHVRIRQLEWSAYKEAVNKGEADMFYLSWWADYPDPENFLFPLFHSSNHGAAGNRTRYTSHAVDALIEEGQSAAGDRKRYEFYRKAEQIIVEDSPWVPLWHRTDFAIRQPWVKNYKIYPIYSMDKGTDISL
ncbi:MAG TPA: ABC transporter substrate-binding protein [Thermodesulfovibrionales bacterium]|nr:ABC transporter substrate-binding protein [Thermodesulfovibrionales bacterium]